jgi:hypothetical protein
VRVTPLKPLLIATLGFGIASPVLAQGYSYGQANSAAGYGANANYSAGSNIPQPQGYAYERQMQQYRDQQAAYQDQQASWRAQQDAYDARRAGYDSDRQAYEYERAHYDAIYGAGAWERRYGY